ncbi:MAG: oligoendopeptidase F family protein [Clostridia bacterium]|nr:oligoendopeptidase F family protein [Clostridia bacterium]
MKNRKVIDAKYKWNLKDIYKDENILKEDISTLKTILGEVKEFKGKLNNPDKLLEYYEYSKKVDILFDKVFIYVYLNHAIDTDNDKYNRMLSEIEYMANGYNEASAFVLPELNSYDVSYLESLLEDERFKLHYMGIKDLIKNKVHILPHDVEEAMAKVSKITGEFSEIYDGFDCIDLKIDNALDSKGNSYELTKANYSRIMQNEDRTLRKNASTNLNATYKKNLATLTNTYIASVKKDCFYADMYKYKDCLTKKVEGQDINEKIFYNLIDNVNKHLYLYHNWLKVLKEALGYEKLYGYDLSVPLAKNTKEYSFDEGCEHIRKAIAPLGEDYVSMFEHSLQNNWYDVYPTLNKDTGGCCVSVYGEHPYILLNHEGTYNDVSAIAHELGHALHYYYTERKQPYEYNDITIFMAEMASTTNEVLLLKHMYETAKTREEKIFFLQEYIDLFVGALYIQTRNSEFEDFAHKLVEKSEPITRETLFNKHQELVAKYNGGVVEQSENSKHSFLIVPHYYRAYYMFSYATGVTCAVNFAKMCEKGQEGIEKYREFLSSGSSDYPLNILKKCGIDLETDAPYEIIFEEFEWAINEIKSLL